MLNVKKKTFERFKAHFYKWNKCFTYEARIAYVKMVQLQVYII